MKMKQKRKKDICEEVQAIIRERKIHPYFRFVKKEQIMTSHLKICTKCREEFTAGMGQESHMKRRRREG